MTLCKLLCTAVCLTQLYRVSATVNRGVNFVKLQSPIFPNHWMNERRIQAHDEKDEVAPLHGISNSLGAICGRLENTLRRLWGRHVQSFMFLFIHRVAVLWWITDQSTGLYICRSETEDTNTNTQSQTRTSVKWNHRNRTLISITITLSFSLCPVTKRTRSNWILV